MLYVLMFGVPFVLNALGLLAAIGVFVHAVFNRRPERMPALTLAFACIAAVGLVWWSVTHRLDAMSPITVLALVGMIAAAVRGRPRFYGGVLGALVLLSGYAGRETWRARPLSPEDEVELEAVARSEEAARAAEAETACLPLREDLAAFVEADLDCSRPGRWTLQWEQASDAGTPPAGYAEVASRLEALGTEQPRAMAQRVRLRLRQPGPAIVWEENVTQGALEFGLIAIPLDGGIRVLASGAL